MYQDMWNPLLVTLVIFLVLSWNTRRIYCMGYSGAGERTPLFVYNREFLLSCRAFPTDITFHVPDECKRTEIKPPKMRKRGRKGGVKTRLRKYKFRTTLPTIIQGNVRSIRNKTDELRANVQHLREYRESSLICLTETWLSDNDPDSSVDLEGYQFLRMDRNQNSGKTKGGGIGVFVNEQFCNPSHITVKHKVCTKDIELLAIYMRPYYLPREIPQIQLFVVYYTTFSKHPDCCKYYS